MTQPAPSASDVNQLIRSRSYRGLLVLAAAVGILVSLASWCFLELVHYLQQWLYKDLPSGLGFHTDPWWWPLPILLVAGVTIAFAVARLPGDGGHQPSEGLKSGPPTLPNYLPGVVLAALATLGLGLVLGPEAPLIALGTGLAMTSLKLARRDVPDRAKAVLAAAGAFAAISTIFGSPVIGAVIIIEATGLGGPTLPLVLLPGLLAAGIGSLVFIGIGSLTGLSEAAYQLAPLTLPSYARPTVSAFGWTILLAVVAAVVVFLVVELGKATGRLAGRSPFVVMPVAAVLVGAAAIAFGQITGENELLVLFSGQEAMDTLVTQAATLSLGTLALLLVFKSIAWGLSLGAARGGPTFPAMFLGIVGGLLAGHLPGFAEQPAVAALMGAACVAVLRLPLSSLVIAFVVSRAGAATTPLIIVAVVVAYLAILALDAVRTHASGAGRPDSGQSPPVVPAAAPATGT